MFCNKCGAQLEDGALFCSECGEKCPEQNISTPENESSTNGANYQGNNNQGANYTDSKQAPLFVQEDITEENQSPNVITEEDTPDVERIILPEKPKKGKKFLKVFIPIVAGIAVICLVAVLFGRAIFFAVAPEAYVANLIKATSDEVSKEMNQIEENVFGFDITMDNEMTVGAKMNYNDAHNKFDFDINIANDPKKSKLLFDGNFENEYGKGSGHGFIGNETAGFMLPGSDKKYLSIPTKDFGKQFESADGFMTDYMSRDTNDNREQAYDLITSLNLSYDSLKQAFSSDKNTAKKFNKHVSDNLIKLLKDSEIGNRQKTVYEFDNKETGAYEITLTVEEKALYDCYIDTLKSIADDDKIKKPADYNVLLDIIEELEKQADNSDTEISDYEIRLIEYKGKIVSVEIVYTETYEYKDEYPEYGDHSSTTETEHTVIFSFTNSKKLLNGIRITSSEKLNEDYKDPDLKDYSRESQSEISFASDWATKRKLWDKDIITIAMLSTSEYDGSSSDYSNEISLDFAMDFKKENWSLDIKAEHDNGGDTDTDRQSYDGKCSKKDGFSFTVNEKWTEEKYEYNSSNSMTYNEWVEDEFDRYRNDYLEDIYDDKFWYSYDSYYDWYNSSSRNEWDVADSDFRKWLYDKEYYYYDSLYDAYDSKTRQSERNVIPVDAYAKFELTLKNNVGIKDEEGKNDNILEWSEDDFYDFGDAFMDKTRK